MLSDSVTVKGNRKERKKETCKVRDLHASARNCFPVKAAHLEINARQVIMGRQIKNKTKQKQEKKKRRESTSSAKKDNSILTLNAYYRQMVSLKVTEVALKKKVKKSET